MKLCMEAAQRMRKEIKTAQLKTVVRPVLVQLIDILKTQRTETGHILMKISKHKILLINLSTGELPASPELQPLVEAKTNEIEVVNS